MPDENAPRVQQLLLMNLAVAGPGKPGSMEHLPETIDAQLRSGGRVIVGRLYDKDEDQLPWYGLAGHRLAAREDSVAAQWLLQSSAGNHWRRGVPRIEDLRVRQQPAAGGDCLIRPRSASRFLT